MGEPIGLGDWGFTWVDHLSTMLDGDLDDFVAGEISSDGGILTTLANDVGFVGLCYQIMLAKKKKSKTP